jgi:hypothetical protein
MARGVSNFHVQIPADLLSFTGNEDAPASARLKAVEEHVASIRTMIKKSDMDPHQRGSCKPTASPSLTRTPTYTRSASPVEPSVSFVGRNIPPTGHRSVSSTSYAQPTTRSDPGSGSGSGSLPERHAGSSSSSAQGTAPRFEAHPEKPSTGSAASQEGHVHDHSKKDAPVPTNKPHDTPAATTIPETPALVASPATQDLTQLPALLDREFLRYDGGAALRPTIITPDDHGWVFRSYPSIMCKTPGEQSWSRYSGDLTTAKAAAFDLLDALSRSGALTLQHASLHILVAATHHFTDTLLDTVVQKHINPIEAVERSQLIVASTIHSVSATDILAPEHISIAALHSSDLLRIRKIGEDMGVHHDTNARSDGPEPVDFK